MKIHWLPEAVEDVERLYHFLAEIEPRAAGKALDCVMEAATRLQKYPELGRLMRDDGARREWVAPFGAGAYVLRYRLTKTHVVILRVWHSREWRD